MDPRKAVALLAAAVALSLVAAPVTMADWSEQASFSVERIDDPAQLRNGTPMLQYESLSAPARDAVRRAIESPDGHHVVYGADDWPAEFFYSDHVSPGRGWYAVVYGGQHYRLTTSAAGAFPFVYWLYELPFVAYGLVLGGVALLTYRGARSPRVAAVAAAPGVAVHLLGPAFDFPLVAPMQFVGLGVVAVAALVGGLLWSGLDDG